MSRLKHPTSLLNPRLLIVRLGAMGDVLHALPAVAMLRRVLPEARIAWVVEHRWRELLCAPETPLIGPRSSGRPLIDELHLTDTRAWRRQPLAPATRTAFLLLRRDLREREYDVALDLQGSIKSAFFSWMASPTVILGADKPREAIARLAYDGRIKVGAKHVIEQYAELTQGLLAHLGLSPATTTLQPGAALLPRAPQSEERVDKMLSARGLARARLAVLNPGAGWAAKQWPTERYGELAAALAARGLTPIINFGPGEQELAKQTVEHSRGTAQLFSTTISEFAALVRRSHLFVGGDTGPMHMAALLGVPTVALFGPTDPERNGPYWAGCTVIRESASQTSYSHRNVVDPGLEQLTVERVAAECLELLD